jgi:ERCC4-related helicase
LRFPILHTTPQLQVITNLNISHIELRTEDDPEVVPYTHERQIDVIPCEHGSFHGQQALRKLVNSLLQVPVQKLHNHSLMSCGVASEVNVLYVGEAEE